MLALLADGGKEALDRRPVLTDGQCADGRGPLRATPGPKTRQFPLPSRRRDRGASLLGPRVFTWALVLSRLDG